jgi:endonuclease/exonuclease/phosphatase family metal-dependent hydrolase
VTPVVPRGDRIRVATLNVLYYPQGDRWRERRPLVEAQVAELRPDLLTLQEVNRLIDQDHALAAAIPERGYRVFRASETVRPRYPRHWDGVVWLVAADAGAVEAHDVLRMTHLRVVDAVRVRRPSGTTVTALATHLHHPDGPPGFEARRRQVRTMLRWLDGLPPSDVQIVAGDLNAVPMEPAIQLLRDAGFRSAYEEVHGRHDATFPSGLVAPSIYRGPGFPIDYVWVRGAASIADAAITLDRPSPTDAGLFPSDHRGVSTDLVLADRAAGQDDSATR